jgi:hypothetical protein
MNHQIDISESIAKEKSKKTLNKPFRLPKGEKKKFGVYVKNKKGNTVMVKFGDPNMEIKRDDPERKKAFRARHKCDQKKDKTKAGYWSCRLWDDKPVSKILKASLEEEFFDQEVLVGLNSSLANCEIVETDCDFCDSECECDKNE